MPVYQIAIDGPAASGKSTVARLVAAALGGYYVNTGDMYRAVSWAALEAGIDPEHDPDAVVAMLARIELRYQEVCGGEIRLMLNGVPVDQAAIRTPQVARMASLVARIAPVREWLKERQRETRNLGTIVMEGRDIGTVILPDASHKFFLTASPEERARRRLAQEGETPPGATIASVAAAIAERDHIDSTREAAPLKAAPDAIRICSDGMTPEQVRDAIITHVQGGAS